MSSDLTEIFGEPISVYTRAQAIEDGMLADVSEWAREVGFRAETVITASLWALVDVDSRGGGGVQSTRGRAHDVLWLASLALGGAFKRGDDRAQFTVKLGRENVRPWVVADGDGVTIGLAEDF